MAASRPEGDHLPSVIRDVDVFKRNLLASMPKPKFADYMADSLVWLCFRLRWPPRHDLYGDGPPVGLLL